MTLLATIVAFAAPTAGAPCDRDCQAAHRPPCATTCTTTERRGMTRELNSIQRRAADLRRWARWARIVDGYRDWLGRLRWCESRNNWRIVNSIGAAGGFQFLPATWRSVGGFGTADQAHPLEQSYRAVLLRKRSGTAPWSCKVGS